MTTAADQDRPIFIVGAPRSGTTLLQYMLRSHPEISLPTGESHFLIPLYRDQHAYGDLSRVENITRVLEAMEARSASFLHTDLHGLRFDIPTIARRLAESGCGSMRELISGLFQLNARGEGKTRWGDKTPYYVLQIPKLVEWWPHCQIIHLIRDGRDVALSMFERRHDFRAYNTYMVAKEWQNYVDRGRASGKTLDPTQYLEIRYEDMLADQKSALMRICDFLGATYSDELLEFKKAGIAGKTPLLQKPVQKNNRDKWRTQMSPRQISVFESVASDTLSACGYELATQSATLPLPTRALYRLHHRLTTKWFQRFGPKKKKWQPDAREQAS